MHFENHREALAELRLAALWYGKQDPALAHDFLAEFRLVLAKIRLNPDMPPLISRRFRKVRFGRFPYAIIYELGQDSVYIMAVIHLHRRPFYWVPRSANT